jgi:hypothetical protein
MDRLDLFFYNSFVRLKYHCRYPSFCYSGLWFVCSSVVIDLRKQLIIDTRVRDRRRKEGKMKASDIIPGLAFAFDRALAAADLIFLPSTVHKHTECGVEV